MRTRWIVFASLLIVAGAARPCDAQRIESRAVEARAVPREAAHQGSIVVARRWNDRLGENLLLITRTDELPSKGHDPEEGWEDLELYAYHYVRRGGAWSLLWRTVDFERECDLDLTLETSPRTVAITDLDADGVAETTFMYMQGCRGGVDPLGLKLIMHEGAAKYAIRGSTDLSYHGPGYARAVMVVDPSFARAPAAFRTFAVSHWKKFEKESAWSDESR